MITKIDMKFKTAVVTIMQIVKICESVDYFNPIIRSYKPRSYQPHTYTTLAPKVC